jgi:D-serine deaminase-like pyridoxal phosphate-dependent protein
MILSDLDTPCLLVEQRRLDANLRRMQARADAHDVALRPHLKTHKSAAIARRQRDLGARGITVAKPEEAEVFADAGFDDVRLAYCVVGRAKYERLLKLMERGVRVSFCVDTVEGARLASAFFAERGATAEVLIEVDTGHGRCGVEWDSPHAPALAKAVRDLPGLRLVGLLTHGGQGYFGPVEGETRADALVRTMREERDRLLALAERLHAADALDVGAELSVGSTPTMSVFENAEAGRPEGAPFRITEIRPGNYAFHDAEQVALGAATLPACALTVYATVVSKQPDERGGSHLFLDAGKKVFTTDTGYGTSGYGVLLYNPTRMVPLPHAELFALSEEHGWVRVPGAATLDVGDRVRVVPNHACVVVNTQRELVVIDGEEVVERVAVDARGAVR